MYNMRLRQHSLVPAPLIPLVGLIDPVWHGGLTVFSLLNPASADTIVLTYLGKGGGWLGWGHHGSADRKLNSPVKFCSITIAGSACSALAAGNLSNSRCPATYFYSSTCGLVGKWLYDHFLKLMNNCVC